VAGMTWRRMSNASPNRRLKGVRFRTLIFLSALVGTTGGALAAAYYYLLEGALFVVWELLAGAVGPLWLVTGIGGLLVGLSLKFLGVPGEIAAVVDNIHLRRGRIDIRQTPSMIVASLLSISFGGSAGPEAPLVQIIGSLGSWFGDRLRLYGHLVRTLTFCGMAAALGAFFGAPLGGALFALEIPHRRGMEYYEALIPSLVAAFLSFEVFRSLVPSHGVLYPFPGASEVTLLTVGMGVGLGVLGAGMGLAFIALFRSMGRALHRFESRPVILATAGGLSLGLLASAYPGDLPMTLLFWGEYQLRDLLLGAGTFTEHFGGSAIWVLLLVALGKAVAIGLTLHTGFRGGFIFPLFFIGAVGGMALSLASGDRIPLAIAALCLMAALNVAVTRTPISTTVILTTLSGTSMVPVIGAASLVSFLLTTPVPLIRTQRPRRHHPLGGKKARQTPPVIRAHEDDSSS
jgi:H+/Cl- antiporter ClcA